MAAAHSPSAPNASIGLYPKLLEQREADELATFSFKQMEVKVRKLARRHQVKVATDGEVTMMSNPQQFPVLRGKCGC